MFKITVAVVSICFAASAIAKPEQVSFKTADGIRVFGDVYRSGDGDSAGWRCCHEKGTAAVSGKSGRTHG